MSTPRDSQWFFDRARSHLASARLLDASEDAGILPEEGIRLLHGAIEKSLKAALISRGLWDGIDRRLRVHRLGRLAQELADNGFPIPTDLLQDIGAASEIPRIGEGPCEMYEQAGYADNLDWSQICLPDLFALAERVIEHIQGECGFS